MTARPWRRLLVALPFTGCALGYRGEAAFSAEHDLAGIQEIRIELPDTPLSVNACTAGNADCPESLTYDGRWVTLGGTRDDAERNATAARLQFTRDREFAALQAMVPLSRVGLVDLEMDELRVPDDRDLDLRTGVGDVEVFGVAASVVISVHVGDVVVRGADAGLGVHTERGQIEVETPGHAELRTDDGDIEITQTGDARDLVARAGEGSILVHLASDADLDLAVRASGTIRVRTPAIATVTTGKLERRTGTGTVRVEIVAADDVEIDITAAD